MGRPAKKQSSRGARKSNPSKPKAKRSDEVTPHKLLGDLVAVKYNAKQELEASKSIQIALFRPDFRRARRVLQERVDEEIGDGFVAAIFAGNLWGAKLNGKGEVVDEGIMGPFEVLQAGFGEVERVVNKAFRALREQEVAAEAQASS